MENDTSQKRIAELLLESRDLDAFSSDARIELNELIRESEQNREFAAAFLLDGDALAELLATGEIASLAGGERPNSTVVSGPVLPGRNRGRWLAAAALLVLSALAVFLFSQIDRRPIAEIRDEAGAVFAGGALPTDGRLEQASYTLAKGLVAVEFRNGVSMTVQAPAEFEIVDDFRVKLHRGQLRAHAPESGHGFIIETPKAEFEDLGTEFGVVVDPQTGASEVHVFDGEVDVRKPGEETVVASLRGGDSIRVAEEIAEADVVGLESFPTAEEIGLLRWLQSNESLRADPDLVLYYDFREVSADDVLTDQSSASTVMDGRIDGARWVTGRWPGKQALLFDRGEDRVELEIPGELPALSFSAWVNIDRFDFPLSALMNSVGWEEGDVHFQISRTRKAFQAGLHPMVKRESVEADLPTGRWLHFAATFDPATGRGSTWIDGKLTGRSTFAEGAVIRPGRMILGNWEHRTKKGAIQWRGFRGRIDEVALWKRALSPEEIRELFLAGQPM